MTFKKRYSMYSFILLIHSSFSTNRILFALCKYVEEFGSIIGFRQYNLETNYMLDAYLTSTQS